MGKQKKDKCVHCGEEMKAWTVTCPHCGKINGGNKWKT